MAELAFKAPKAAAADQRLVNAIADKARRESMRWEALQVIDLSRPDAVTDTQLQAVLAQRFDGLTRAELRRCLDYLADKGLLRLSVSSFAWWARLTYQGVDLVEYTVADTPGIARPAME